ncbi:hypothetical protein BH20ACT2_BH20ACT2_02940 [soil metagenome]
MLGRRLVKRQRDGRFKLSLGAEERRLLGELAPQLEELLGGDDPSLRRLSPPAYLDDAEADAEFRSLLGDDLLIARRAQLQVLAETADADVLDEEQLLAWMGAVNALRLVLGTRLDVSEDGDAAIDPDDPNAPALALYGYLGWLLEHLVGAAADS